MIALVVLGLIACESASSFKFNTVTENHDKVKYYPNIEPSNNYDNKLVILNEQKKNTNIKKIYLDLKIENMDMQKKDLEKEIEKIDRKKEYLDSEIEKLNMQKDNLDGETDIIYKKIDNFDRSIDYLNTQKDQLDIEIEKINLEVEGYNIDSDHDIYNIHRAAVEDNEYEITIHLAGYNENEIVVKSGSGRLVVQALHNVLGEPKRSFQNIRSLPNFVTENGNWSYKWGVLRIVFPVIQRTRYETNNVVYQNGVGGEPTFYSSSQKKELEKTTEVEPTTYSSSQKNRVETTVSITKQDDDSEVTTFIPTYVPKQDDDIVTSIYIPNKEATTNSVTANDVFLKPIVY